MAHNLKTLTSQFGDEDKAREFLENLRWPDGPVCPKCGSTKAYRLTPKAASKKPGRKGLIKCGDCKKQYTVTVGTAFEASHVPLSKWVIAIHLLCASKKGMSAHQLHRMLGLQYKTAWFLAHRIRFGMAQSPLAAKLMGVIEVDETYIGPKEKNKHANKKLNAGRGTVGKQPVLALVQRGGDVRTFPIEKASAQILKEHIRKNVQKESVIMTDDFKSYRGLGKEFAGHESVNHSAGEYVRDEAHTNTVEGFFGILKRGLTGVYQHVSEQHLHRYLAEFEFRYNSRKIEDGDRMLKAIGGFEGKRLMYRDSSLIAN